MTWWSDPLRSVVEGRGAFTPERTPVGDSVAARACSFWAFAEREMAAGPAGYTPARDTTR